MKPLLQLLCLSLTIFIFSCHNASPSSGEQRDTATVTDAGAARWPAEKANQWYQQQGGWLIGCNYTPAYAINELEMWQADSFDTARIDLELSWAQELGFNTVRVFLQNLLWQQDSTGFLNRMDQFLQIADRHKIGAMFVFFDGCWNPDPRAGKQPAPVPHVHNSGWVQSPGAKILSDTTQYPLLKAYLQGVMTHFKEDRRVRLWDLFNEPDNDNGGRFPGDLNANDKYKYAFILLKDAFEWAREVNPSQPLTVAPWHRNWSDTAKMDPMDRFMFDHSDVISFHCYAPLEATTTEVKLLQRYGRPLICSEYMARPIGSTFATILPFFHEQHTGAINWGFVSGKTQTIYPWDSWQKKYTAEPKLWFHDIFRTDGTPYDPKETALIRRLTGMKE